MSGNDEKSCHKCGCAMSLLDEHEWPESDDLIYCATCSIDVIRELRGTMTVSDNDNRTPGYAVYMAIKEIAGDIESYESLDDEQKSTLEKIAHAGHSAIRSAMRSALEQIAHIEITAAENAGEMIHQRVTYQMRSIARDAIGMEDC